MSKIYGNSYSRKDIEDFAVLLRRVFKIKENERLPVIEIAENIIPIFDNTYTFCICEENEMPKEYANYSPMLNTMNVRQNVYIDVCNGIGRHRYTIAHEIGHYFLHKNISVFSRCENGIHVPAYMDPEWQANVFASAFLMPPKSIINMTPYEISEHFGTSMQAATIALKTAKKSQVYT